MKIATFNVNSIRSRLPVLSRWLPAAAPDILCVQETKVRDEEFPSGELSALGYGASFRGEKSYNGVAILWRRAPDEITFGLPVGTPPDETRMAVARFGRLWIVNTYVPQGRAIDHPMYLYKLEWMARLRRFFDGRFRPADDWVLWTGDLNVAAEPADVFAPEAHADHVCYHAEARRAFGQCQDWGFVDVFRRFHPEGGQYSFYDYRTPNAVRRGIGWRLDYLLASPPLAATATGAWIDLAPRLGEKPSDHAPVVGVFNCDIWEPSGSFGGPEKRRDSPPAP